MDGSDDNTEDLVLCSHCKKEVARANLPMHEAHCQRFLCICPDCDESVPKDQLEEHRVEQHSLVRCKMCNKKMQRYKLPDHETYECTERLVSCEFCELEFPLSALEDHAVICGSRTERCPDCKQYVKLKDQTHHAQICSSAVSEDDNSNDEEYSYKDTKQKPADNLQDDLKVMNSRSLMYNSADYGTGFSEDLNLEEAEKATVPNFYFHQTEEDMGAVGYANLDQISTCPHCHLALPLQTLQWHMKKCKIFEIQKLVSKAQK